MYGKNLFSRKNLKKASFGAAAVIAAVLGWHIYQAVTGAVPVPKNIPVVRTFTVGTSQHSAADFYPGEVRGRYESQLAFQVGGKINARLVNVGDRVTAGQTLFTIDPKDVREQFNASSAQLASASAAYKLAAADAARYQKLYAAGAVSKAVLDQYQTQLEASDAALKQAQAQAQTSANQLEYSRLVSDCDGVIAAVNGEAGQVVAAGSPVVTIVKNGDREIEINIPENKLPQIRVGQQAEVTFWALPEVKTSGTVREIAPAADSVTRTYRARIAVNNLPETAKLGMTAKANFTAEAGGKILIPAAAVYQTSEQTQVWLARDNRAVLQNITVQGYAGDNVIVSAGLHPGDAVITAGLNQLLPNQQVRAESGDAV